MGCKQNGMIDSYSIHILVDQYMNKYYNKENFQNYANTMIGSIKESLLFRELSVGARQSIKSPTHP